MGEDGEERGNARATNKTDVLSVEVPSLYASEIRLVAVLWQFVQMAHHELARGLVLSGKEGEGGGTDLDVFPVLHPHHVRLVDHGYLDATQEVVVPNSRISL